MQEEEINTSTNLKQQYVLITEEEKIPFMLSYIKVLPQSKIMIFVSTISEVEYLDYLLNNITYRNSNG
jgi:superfamily II DNA/RNA helicase